MKLFMRNAFVEALSPDAPLPDGAVAIAPTTAEFMRYFDLTWSGFLPDGRHYVAQTEDPKAYEQLILSQFRQIEAAGGLVEGEDGILFIFRNGLWDLPKGKLEGKETAAVGALREVEEECNLKAELSGFLTVTYHTYKMNGKKYLKKTWWYRMKPHPPEQTLKPQREEGIEAVRWFTKKALTEVQENTFASILEVLRVGGCL
jgi:8-oxo-dGTP pyrophosphatase MutT (NUDIX family)